MVVSRGDGSFQSPRTFPSGPNPVSVAIGDLNGDGRRDLVIADSVQDPYIVSVLFNTTGLCTVPNVRGKTLADRKAHDRARRLPHRNNPPLVFECGREASGDLAAAEVRHGVAEG